MKNKTKRRWLNYLIELFIVIIGISIAFWLNNVAIENKNEHEKITYLTDIRNDLKTDSLRLINNIRHNKSKVVKMINAIELIKSSAQIDSVLVYITEIGNYDFFNPENFTLTSLLQSGDLKLIDSELTKRELLRLLKTYERIDDMQQNFLQALDDNYFPMLLTKVDMLEFKAIDVDFFYSVEIKNYCGFALNETNQHIQNYQNTLNHVNKVMMLIDAEIN